MTDFKLGRLPQDPTKPKLRLAGKVNTELSANPPVVDYISRVPSWPMLANDRIGDCAVASVAHMIRGLSTYAHDEPVAVSEQDVVRAYSDISGYNPATGENDNGCVMQDVLNYWRKNGIGGRTIRAFAYVNPRNAQEVDAAIAVFGHLYVGLNLPISAAYQLDAGQPWDAVSDRTGTVGSWGGHAVNVGQYNDPANYLTCVTWGRTQPLTEAFWDKYVDEAWVVITDDWLNAQGSTPSGLNLYALGQELSDLTGEPNPFPEPTPEPVPDPTPAPLPVPIVEPDPDPVTVNADQELVEAANSWLTKPHRGSNKVFERAVKKWVLDKGL